MKKFLSLLLAIVMIVSIFPAQILSASAAEVSETLTLAGSTGTVSDKSISWTSGSLTFTANQNTSSNAIRTTDTDHFRLYVGFSATLTCSAGNITKIVMTATGSSYAIAPTGSDGSVGTVSGTTITIVPTASSNTYTISSITKQTRIKSIAVTYSTVDSSECAHTNTETIEAVAATCTTAGNTEGVKCTDCGATVSGNETIAALGHTNDEGVVTAATCTTDGYTLYTCTVCGSTKKSDYVDATGHSYVDGTCSACGIAMPTGLDGKYYIAAIRSSGNYFYLTNTVNDKSRYVAVDSTLSVLPESITDSVDAQIFELIFDASTATYKIKTGDQYLGWTSGNTGALVDEASAVAATIEYSDVDGAYNIHFTATDAERYLALNNTAGNDYFVWYKQGQAEDLCLIPVACSHTNTTSTTVDATCTEVGSTTVVCSDCGETVSTEEIAALGHSYVDNICSVCGAEFETEIDQPDVCEHATTNTFEEAATCVTDGSITVICEDCGETISTEVIPATGEHTVVTDEAVAATCTATGLTEGSHCSVCNTVIVAQEEITALGHSYVGGTCSTCGEAEPVSYELVTADTVRAGNYIIGAIRSSSVTYPAVYLATGSVSSGDMVVASTSTTATDDVIALAADAGAQVFVLTGDATNGFTIGYNNGTEMVYLGYTSIANRKLAFSADYSNILWKVETFGSGVMLTDGNINIFENSTGTSAIRGYTTTYTSARGIYLFREVVENECIHTVETWTVDVAPTCTANGTQSGVCTLCGETQTSAVPATGHTLAYSESAIICANGCDYSQAYTLSTIADAKAYTDTTLVYYVKGSVTYVDGAKVYIEDATGGLLVNFTSADAASGIALGDEILVWDTMTTWNALIETTYTLASEYVKASSGNALPSQTVTIADLLADTTNEYLAERVVIENVTIGTINESGNTALTDADGNSINIYKVSGLSEDINENDTVTVTAVVSTYNGYQLLVNPGTAATDVVETVSGEETVITTVTIAEAKAGTAGAYYQVEGTVTYISGRYVYIQDATGGIVVYLTANATTTQVGDAVKAYGTLATYNGLIELTGIDETNTEFYSILSSGNTVDAQAVTIADLTADTSNEYLAEKISLTGVYVSYYSYNSTYGNVTYYLVDGNGNSITVYRTTVASEAECVAGGSIVNVEAVVTSYNGYQLLADNANIVATGTCDHENTTLITDVAPTYTTVGSGNMQCDVCQNYVIEDVEIPVLDHPVTGWNLILGDTIGVNFEMTLAENDKVTATVAGDTVEVQINDGMYSVEVAAAQMTDEILLFVNDMQLNASYSVRGYADEILAGEYDDEVKTLVKAMLVYGGASQNYFVYNNSTEENLANNGITVDAATVPTEGGDVTVSGSVSGVTFYGASLSHRNKIAVRFYFIADSIEGITFKVGETEYTPVPANGMYYIEVANILPQDLDQDIEVVVGGSLTVAYAPMDYIIRMNGKANASDTTKALVQALYGYHVAAKAYVEDPTSLPENDFS